MSDTATAPALWACEEIAETSHAVHLRTDWTVGWEQYVLLSADRHWDNPKSDLALQRKHLEEARRRGAPVVDVGDFFCVMQGRGDKRRSKDDIRPEHMGADYLDRVVDTAAEFFAPYADLFAVIGRGNHDGAIWKYQETDLLRRFAHRVKHAAGLSPDVSPFIGGYGGWVTFRFHSEEGSTNRRRRSVRLKYFHGSGGGGPVTKGVIQTNRRATFLPDADIVATGHIHEQWSLRLARERLSRHGKVYHDEQLHVQIPTYKEEYKEGAGGWHVERGAPPKPIGATWLRFYVADNQGTIRYETTPAR